MDLLPGRWFSRHHLNFPIAFSHSLHRTQRNVLTTRQNLRTRKVSMNDVPVPSPATSSSISATKSATHGQLKSKVSDGPRPHTRPRGMTDNTGIRPSLRKDPDRLSLKHKSSFSRSIVTPPETSPPSQELPPVPSLTSFSSLPNSDGSPSDPGSSSSSLSFASSFEYDRLPKNPHGRLQSVRNQAKIPSEPRTKSPTRVLRGALNPTLSKRPATSDGRIIPLKKIPSQPSFQKSLPAPHFDQSLDAGDVFGPTKLLKKQRSLHHHRVPVPPLPHLRHATSFTPTDAPESHSPESPKDREKEKQKEQRESTASLSKRRFLPGSIRRGSSSQMAAFTFDDDTGSIIIPLSELDRYDKSLPSRFSNPFGSPGVESMMLPATSAFYDDLASSPTAGSHFPHSTEAQLPDVGPQQILSQAQLLQLEEMLENDDSEASTDISSRTGPTELSSLKDSSPTKPPPFEEFGFGNTPPKKQHSWTDSIISASTIFSSTTSDKNILVDRVETGSTLSFFDQQQQSGYRPRTNSDTLPPLDSSPSMKRSHSAFTSSSQSVISMGIESTFGIEPNQPLGGLTPPPRPRPKISISSKGANGTGRRGSMAHIQPLSPPPLRRNTTSTSASSRSTSSRSSLISSPASPPSAFKTDPPMRGIMKKPSFLEIEDDPEADEGTRVRVMISGDIHKRNTSISSIDDSFLDLGRENNSFDTIRTLSVEGPG